MSKERFLYLEKIYPDLDDNYVFFFKIIIESLPYLNDAEFIYAKNEAETLWGRVSHVTEMKVRIKYDLFRYIPNMYFKLFKKCWLMVQLQEYSRVVVDSKPVEFRIQKNHKITVSECLKPQKIERKIKNDY